MREISDSFNPSQNGRKVYSSFVSIILNLLICEELVKLKIYLSSLSVAKMVIYLSYSYQWFTLETVWGLLGSQKMMKKMSTIYLFF